jgi:hypothetical protein
LTGFTLRDGTEPVIGDSLVPPHQDEVLPRPSWQGARHRRRISNHEATMGSPVYTTGTCSTFPIAASPRASLSSAPSASRSIGTPQCGRFSTAREGRFCEGDCAENERLRSSRRHPRKRVIRYSRGSCDRIERPQCIGTPCWNLLSGLPKARPGGGVSRPEFFARIPFVVQ